MNPELAQRGEGTGCARVIHHRFIVSVASHVEIKIIFHMIYCIYISAFLFAIFSLVLVHEFGHFLVARLCGVKVERFSIGFGKPFYKYKSKSSGTEYVVAPVLFGGYVKLLDTREKKVERKYWPLAFDHQPILQRTAIILAGAVANIIFALLAFWLMFVIGFKLPKPIIGKVESNSIASRVSMRSGEEIVKVDHSNTSNWEEVIVAMLAHIGDDDSINITTQASPMVRAHNYRLDLMEWKIDPYKPDPLLDFGIVRYMPQVLPIINVVAKNSPAAKSGLQPNDRIIKVDGKRVNDWKEFIALVKAHPEQSLQLLIKRDKKVIDLVVTTDWKFSAGWKKVGYLGVAPIHVAWPEQMVREYHYSMLSATGAAWQKLKLFVDLNYIICKKLVTGKLSFHIIGGPISILAASGQALLHGSVVFLNFLAVISLAIALINLLPLPGLDGSYAILFLIEAIRGRPLSMRLQVLLLRLGMIFIVLLIIQATLNDLRRIFS